MTYVLDAGAFVALERNDPAMWRRLKAAVLAGDPPRTHGAVVAQVWRGGTGRQAMLARSLTATAVVALDGNVGRSAGMLLAATGQSDPVDAAVAAIAFDGDSIVTSDPGDLAALAAATGRLVDIVTT